MTNEIMNEINNSVRIAIAEVKKASTLLGKDIKVEFNLASINKSHDFTTVVVYGGEDDLTTIFGREKAYDESHSDSTFDLLACIEAEKEREERWAKYEAEKKAKAESEDAS